MIINKRNYIITYCSNIFKTKKLKKLILNISSYTKEFKKKYKYVSLCMSNNLLNKVKKTQKFNKFLFLKHNKNFLINSINGFVYQDFHKKNIKQNIYLPDWTSKYRLLYTNNLISLITYLNIINNKISVSTLPLSFRTWIKKKDLNVILYKTILNFKKILPVLKKNKTNISIEPEPCCLLECYLDIIIFYNNWVKKIIKNFKKYICLCYDICHFSVNFDKHEVVINSISKYNNIKIAKIQISAALQKIIPKKNIYINLLLLSLLKVKKSNFLHQCVIKYNRKKQVYNDIDKIILLTKKKINSEIKIHCHIPTYRKKFKYFNTTYLETKKTIAYIKKHTNYKNLEIESYTYHFFFKKFCYNKSIKKEYAINIKE